MQQAGMDANIKPVANAFASRVPRAMPCPALRGAMCQGPSPLWQELAREEPNMGSVLAMEGDWLHVNKVMFGRGSLLNR
jgi:hypothetical protein